MWKRLHPIQWVALVLIGSFVTAIIVYSVGQRMTGEPSAVDACAQAMEEAAAVPPGESNDDEFMVTLLDCDTSTDWMNAVRDRPDALGLSAPTGEEVVAALQTACWTADDRGISSPVCEGARNSSDIQ